jgi:hypothetical protein
VQGTRRTLMGTWGPEDVLGGLEAHCSVEGTRYGTARHSGTAASVELGSGIAGIAGRFGIACRLHNQQSQAQSFHSTGIDLKSNSQQQTAANCL